MLGQSLAVTASSSNHWHTADTVQNLVHFLKSRIVFLALIPIISAYYGVTQVGWSLGDGPVVKLSSESAAVLCAISYFSVLLGVYLLGVFINWMSAHFSLNEDNKPSGVQAMALAISVMTPLLLVGIFQLYPNIWLNVIVTCLAGTYSVYLIYEGAGVLMGLAKEQAFIFATSVMTVVLVLLVAVRVIAVLLWSLGIGPVYID